MKPAWTTALRAASIGVCFLAISGIADADQTPATPAFVDATARLPYRATAGKATLNLKIDGLDAPRMALPTLLAGVADFGDTTVAKIENIEVHEQPSGKTARYFVLSLTVSGFAPNDTQARNLRFVLDGTDKTLPYTLTNTAAATFNWSPSAQSTDVISPGAPIPISVVVGPVAATGVKILQVGLADTVTKSPMSGGNLFLCPTRTVCDGDKIRIDLPANSPNTVYVHGTSGPGQYTGSVTVAANEKPAGDAVAMTVYSSSVWPYKVAGVGAILIGVLVSWFLTVYLKNKLNRDQLLLPAMALRSKRDQLARDLADKNHTGISTNQSAAKLTELEQELSDAALEANGLPRKVQPPWPSPIARSATNYQTYIQGISDWLSALIVIVSGLENAFALYLPGNEIRNKAVAAAAGKIDAFSAAPAPIASDQLAKSIREALAMIPPLDTGSVAADAEPNVGTPSERYLNIEIDRVSTTVWGLVALLTTALGSYLLIFSANGSGYGTTADYFTSFLWGIGLPSGTALLLSTKSSLESVLTIAR